jgi:hypothetical protein
VLLFISVISLLTPGSAQDEFYRPPDPIMDYVPQYLGIYDTYYGNFVENDCRNCHGERESMAKRHHYTASAFADCPDGCQDCLTACHSDPTKPDTITHNCLDCHPPTFSVYGGPHHETDFSDSGQCTACHQPDLLVDIQSVKPPFYYPTANTHTPTPFNCENCHWPSGDTPHSSPIDWTKPIEATGPTISGVLYLSKPYRPEDGTHHKGFTGNVSFNCFYCHANDPNNPTWNPYSPLLIRYCENCHSKDTLHGIKEHVTAGHGLSAKGKCIACHGKMPGTKPILGLKPPVITAISPRFGPEGTFCSINGENFGSSGYIILIPRIGETDQICRISSGDCNWTNDVIQFIVPAVLSAGNYSVRIETQNGISNIRVFTLTGTPLCIPCTTQPPFIDSIEPSVGATNVLVLVTIYGQDFGDRHTGDREVLLELPGWWANPAAIHSWTDNKITFHISPWIFPPGVITVKVKTEKGESINSMIFWLREHPYIESIDQSDITHLTLSGTGFGEQQLGLTDDYGWVSTVTLNSPTISVKPSYINKWSDTEIQLTLPSVPSDFYGVTVETVYFYDTNTNGKYDSGVDQVYQTVSSDPVLLQYVKKRPGKSPKGH